VDYNSNLTVIAGCRQAKNAYNKQTGITRRGEVMEEKEKQLCVICAWRQTCQKQFSMKAGQKCPDYCRDVLIGQPEGTDESGAKKED
jgi:hypothetical protein